MQQGSSGNGAAFFLAGFASLRTHDCKVQRTRQALRLWFQTPSGKSARFSVRSTKLDWLWRMPLIL
ncbi:hypothetical protein COAQ111491_04540 [Comamonas aquatilis]